MIFAQRYEQQSRVPATFNYRPRYGIIDLIKPILCDMGV